MCRTRCSVLELFCLSQGASSLNSLYSPTRTIVSAAISLGLLGTVITLLTMWPAYSANHPYIIGDWEISYAGGFVRRGILGEVIRWLSTVLAIEPRLIVISAQTLAYVVLFICGVALTLPVVSRYPKFAFLACSPLTLLFPVASPDGGGRKEILLLALFAVQAVLLLKRAPRSTHDIALLVVTSVLGVIIVLSHEAMVLFIPLQFLLIRWFASPRISYLHLTTAFAPIAIAFFAVAASHGNAQQVAAICQSLGSYAPEHCLDYSAIGWLGMTESSGVKAVYYKMVQPPFIELTTLLGFVLGVMPLALLASDGLLYRLVQNRLRERGGLPLLSIGLSAPIFAFIVASDHGRYLYVWVTEIMFLLAAASYHMEPPAAQPSLNSVVSTPAGQRVIALCWSIFLLLYAVTWNMPGVCCPSSIGTGVLGRTLAVIPF